MKRTRYFVEHCGEVAKFSSPHDAQLFAAMLSNRHQGHWIEVHAPDGLIGQYRHGQPTPEFTGHHIDPGVTARSPD